MNESFPRLTNRFQVPHGYDVCFGRDTFAAKNTLLSEGVSRVFAGNLPVPTLVFLDAGLATAQPGLSTRISAYAAAHPDVFSLRGVPAVLPGGEAAKDGMDVCLQAVAAMRQAGICRQSCVLAVGGGAFQDTVGLAAALFHRGVRVVRLPSTVLSQNDSGVGVKNGVNLDGVKNLLGTFAPPALVVDDLSLLATISDRDWIAGSAEAFKVALIRDADFAEWLVTHAADIPLRDEAVMAELIVRCASLHVHHIAEGNDPFECGSARPLDFGHWSAHKLESLSGFALRHGEAVAIGIALDLCHAARMGFITTNEAERFIRALRNAGLPIWSDWLLAEADGQRVVLAGIEEFREHLGGTLHVTFPCPVGSKREVGELDCADVLTAIGDLDRLRRKLGVAQ
jgi:3-dehydroquinate synthase